jgi:tetratricopeptide (TPR) repeat protein
MKLCLCLLALFIGGVAAADKSDAKRHSDRGRQLYDQGQFQAAMDEFLRARDEHSSPAFDYNIGRCLERLDRWGEAADAYERYLPIANDAEGTGLRAHIDNLRDRQHSHDAAAAPKTAVVAPAPLPPPMPPPTRPVYKRGWFWGVVGGTVAAAAVAVALGVTLGNSPDPSHPITGLRF